MPDSSQKDWQTIAAALLQGSQTDSPRALLPQPWAVVPPPESRAAPPQTDSWENVKGRQEEALPLGRVMPVPPPQQVSSKMARFSQAEWPRMVTQAAPARTGGDDCPALPWPGRSVLAVWPQAAAPCAGPAGKSESETAPGTHDTAQTRAAPPARCAARFPEAQAAAPGVAQLAKHPHEPLPAVDTRSRHQPSAACWWGWSH